MLETQAEGKLFYQVDVHESTVMLALSMCTTKLYPAPVLALVMNLHSKTDLRTI